jgi:hypothetical protein
VADANRFRQFKQRHYRWIALPSLKATEVLLTEARAFFDLFLSQSSFPPQAGEVPANQLAHIHAPSDVSLRRPGL